MDADSLVAIAQEMTATQKELLAKGKPRDAIPSETENAAKL